MAEVQLCLEELAKFDKGLSHKFYEVERTKGVAELLESPVFTKDEVEDAGSVEVEVRGETGAGDGAARSDAPIEMDRSDAPLSPSTQGVAALAEPGVLTKTEVAAAEEVDGVLVEGGGEAGRGAGAIRAEPASAGAVVAVGPGVPSPSGTKATGSRTAAGSSKKRKVRKARSQNT